MPWAPDYLTLTEAKDYLKVPADDTADDAWLATLITAASRAVDSRCNRQFGSAAGTRTYPASDAVPDLQRAGWWLLVVDDIRSDLVASPFVHAGPRAYGTADAVLLPFNATMDRKPYTALRLAERPGADITVATDFWGWPAVPEQVSTAARLQVARWQVRRESPFGVAGSPSDGSETRLLARLDPDVATSLTGLSRTRRPG